MAITQEVNKNKNYDKNVVILPPEKVKKITKINSKNKYRSDTVDDYNPRSTNNAVYSIKLPKPSGKKFFEFLTAVISIIFAGIVIGCLLIALPKTEMVTDKLNYDLQIAEVTPTKSFLVEVDSSDPQVILDYQNLLYTRLRSINVENFSIGSYSFVEKSVEAESIDQTLENLQVKTADATVESAITENGNMTSADATIDSTDTLENNGHTDENADDNSVQTQTKTVGQFVLDVQTNSQYINQLITAKNDIKILMLKDGVDYTSEENQYALYFPDSYDPAPINISYFRNVDFQKLPLTDGTTSWFANFKNNPEKNQEIKEFIKNNNGKIIGVQTDFLVEFIHVINSTETFLAFNVPTEDEEAVKTYDAIINSGKSTTSVTATALDDKSSESLNFDYIKAFITFTLVALAISLFAKNRFATLCSLIVPTGIMIAYHKLTNLPISSDDLIIFIIISSIIAVSLGHNRNIMIQLAILSMIGFTIMHLISYGQISHLALIGLLSTISTIFVFILSDVYGKRFLPQTNFFDKIIINGGNNDK